MKKIQNITVIGAGNMGHQIAISAAIAGFDVICMDSNLDALNRAKDFATNYLSGRVEKGRLSLVEVDKIKSKLHFESSLENAAANTDLVIEAIIENLDIKKDLFQQLDNLCPKHTILATNSSYIVSSQIAPSTNRPDKVCNMHFFNPALVMNLVEIVKGPHVSDETVNLLKDVVTQMGKTPVVLNKEIYGFLVNRILQATRQEALKLLDLGVASHEDIDNAVIKGLGYPMGPFQLLDLTGIDLAYHVGMEKYKASGDEADKPSPTIIEKFEKGEWGKKVGKGFYNY
ncbi:MAG: 3-hydroxyacyl-CoA dehydrogenase family protein [Sediminibacterium sp.]|jgi:3-hydroxybutyryl-CoA dehydrogenase